MADLVSPHNLEAERAVLGAVFIDNGVFPQAAGVVTPDTFFRSAHRHIWRALATVIGRGEAADLVTIKNELDRGGVLEDVGGAAYVASLVDGVPRSMNVEYYARIVKEYAARRAVIATARAIVDRACVAGDSAATITADALAELQATQTRLAGPTGAMPERFHTARETCQRQAQIPVLLAPYLLVGVILSIVGKIKEGKTSTILELVRCLLRRQGFCGFPAPAQSARVLIASEQPQASLSNQLTDAGLHEDEGVFVTYLADWKGQSLAGVGPALVRYAIDNGIRLIVLDTASRWFGFKGDEENQAGGAEHVDVFLPFCANGGTVILSRHGRKSGGDVSDAARGTSAIEGAVDVILHITKPKGHGPEVRQIDALGRFDMPDRLLIQRQPQLQHFDTPSVSDVVVVPRYTFERVGATEGDTPRSRVRASLAKGAKTIQQTAEDTGIPEHTVSRAIKEMDAEVLVVGKGGPQGNARIFGLKATTTTSQSLRDVAVEVDSLATSSIGTADERY